MTLAARRILELLSEATPEAIAEALRLRAMHGDGWREAVAHLDAAQWMAAREVTRLAVAAERKGVLDV